MPPRKALVSARAKPQAWYKSDDEGNGRAGRIWLDHMLRTSLAMTVDWALIDRDDYLLAMQRSPVRNTEIKHLVAGALSPNLDDISLLARGIDASYAYEGYTAYRAQDL